MAASALVLYPPRRAVSRRIVQLIALWFVVQILVPFTAPMQTVDVRDILGVTTTPSTQRAPESSTTPTIREGSAVNGLVSVVAPMASAASPVAGADAVERSPLLLVRRPPPHLRVQVTALRL